MLGVFYAYIEKYMTVFKDKANLYNMYKKNFIKLQMSVTRTYRHNCCEKIFFHRSVSVK